MAYDFITKRLFVEEPLQAGGSISLSPEQANYLLNVLRLDNGAPVLLFNGKDGEWRSKVVKDGKKKGHLTVEEQTRPQTPKSDLTYLFAPLKQARLDYLAQKAVEMGVGRLVPVITQFTQVRQVKTARVAANALEAAEQCGILNLPEVDEAKGLAEAIEALEPDRRLIFCDERHEGDPLAALAALKGERLALLIGPEGGFSDAERSAISARPQTLTISLGPRILRADTAAVAALALVQAAAGDWRQASPDR
ncbi:16S rRNA (uracil(1498)-N(3))-methyltransferase [Afifella sp. YEN Y35]|uniref:16S rRNA (uracil(1498)-N(3))-methyltransferase n=1 Tax=Afifella sp. YEN Y35 TaxID=3388337 RepID=UPI0039DF36D3